VVPHEAPPAFSIFIAKNIRPIEGGSPESGSSLKWRADFVDLSCFSFMLSSPHVNDKECDQRRDALLLRLLKTPPQPRAERKRPRDKAGSKPSRTQSAGTSGENEGADVRR
jgi:hypothetical protein